jgi:uncharacterized protein (TIGR02145 family)
LPGTTYYVKAFAITNSIPYYGDEKSFTTPDTLVLPIIDIDHNIYYPVNIGDQTWMADNLKATRYSDGSIIPRIEDRLTWFNFALYTRAYCWYDNYGAIGATYGGLYTWPAAMNIYSESDIKPGNVQGVCPDGWHLPSDSEWKQLEVFLGMSQAEVDGEEWRGEDEGGKLKLEGIQCWTSPNQPMKVISGHCQQDGVMVPAISRILEHLPGSGPPRREVITPGYGSWIIILPGYIVAPKASIEAILSAA